MSNVAIPSKPSAGRPPVPPIPSTTFDGSPGDDSWPSRLAEDVRSFVRHADATAAEHLATTIELVEMRKRFVTMEIMTAYAFGDLSLPPLNGIPIEYLLQMDDREAAILNGLVDQLDLCRQRCERRLARHRLEVRLSRDLGASDS